MFIKVTGGYGGEILVNTDHVFCIVSGGEKSKIVYTDNTECMVEESIDEVEQMLKGADDDSVSVD